MEMSFPSLSPLEMRCFAANFDCFPAKPHSSAHGTFACYLSSPIPYSISHPPPRSREEGRVFFSHLKILTQPPPQNQHHNSPDAQPRNPTDPLYQDANPTVKFGELFLVKELTLPKDVVEVTRREAGDPELVLENPIVQYPLSTCSKGGINSLEVLNGVGLDLDKGQLDVVLPLPRRPPDPDPSIKVVNLSFYCFCSLGLESRSLVITINLYCLPMILDPHEAHFQALRDLDLCPPTDDPVLDRSTVALYAWGCLPFFGSGKGIEGWSGWIYVELGPRYFDLIPPLSV